MEHVDLYLHRFTTESVDLIGSISVVIYSSVSISAFGRSLSVSACTMPVNQCLYAYVYVYVRTCMSHVLFVSP